MSRKMMVAVVVVAVLATIAIVPLVPAGPGTLAYASSGSPGNQANTTAVGPSGTSTMSDPSGSYDFRYLGNNTWSMDLATYERLTKDPYAGIGGTVEIRGNEVIETMHSDPDVYYGPGFWASPTTQQKHVSVSYWLLGFGGLYSNGKYSFCELIPST